MDQPATTDQQIPPNIIASAILSRENPQLHADLFLAAAGNEPVPHPLHRMYHDLIDACKIARQHVVLVAPPEHAKSQQCAGRMVYELGHNPRMRIGIVSKDVDLASRLMIEARKRLTSPLCRIIWPDIKPDIRRSKSSGEWSAKRLYLTGNEHPAIEVFSRDGASEGARLDMIFMDDCVTRDCSTSEAEREAARSAIHDTWLNRLTGQGIAIVLNNCWHRNDPIHAMLDSTAFSVLWVGYKGTDQLYWRIYHPPNGWKWGTEGILDLWQLWPKERLDWKYAENPKSYRRLFEQRAVLADDMRFPPLSTWAKWHHLPEPGQGEKILAFLDPSGGRNVTKDDYAAIILCMIQNERTMVIDCLIDRIPPEAQIAACWQLHRKWKHEGYQGIYRLGVEMLPKEELWIRQTFQVHQESLQKINDPDWRLNLSIHHPVENKLARIERLGPWLSQGWLSFPANLDKLIKDDQSKSWRHLVEQLEDFPYGDHDDGPDALAGVKDMCESMSPKVGKNQYGVLMGRTRV